MSLPGQLLLALISIHLFWFYCFVTGTLIRASELRSDATPLAGARERNYMAELVITSATGMAILGFVLLLLGFLGQLNKAGCVVWLVLELLLFRLVKGG